MARAIFWLTAVLLAYAYVGYPLVIGAFGRLRRRRVEKSPIEPSVTVIVAAYNEQAGIAAKIENILRLDYPPKKLDVLVASDGSTDATDDIVRDYDSSRVTLHRVEGRVGKTACQNSAVHASRGEIIVFTDATTRLDAHCVSELVSNFSDLKVGCVAGALCYVSNGTSGVGQGGVAYWDYEVRLRRAETQAYGLIGVSGCLYAVRRSA
jgi:cellulose synthase/poly-beta-1,6-N-acetylglucosamine synthase-like glycosyltransferase